jgi:flavin-dependent dehydrogenase
MNNDYDVIVVGARCAGSPTAMLLARQGHRVLMLDRATFPSDTLSTHVVQAPAVAALARWGLLDDVLATGCPPMPTYTFDFGPVSITGTPRERDGQSASYAPRRILLDQILVDAAVAAGVELRQGFNVDDLIIEDGRVTGIQGHDDAGPVDLRATVVVGADGRNSHVARIAGATEYHELPRLQYSYYTYWRDLPVDGFEIFVRPDRGFAAAPTNDGLTMVVVGWPYAQKQEYKADVEANYLATLQLAPAFAERVAGATRVEPFVGGAVPSFFRTPAGPGWALVGDAGYNKDPITAQGINDAFRDAEACSTAIHEALTGRRGYDEAMSDYQTARDADVGPIYDFTAQLAKLEPPPPEMQSLLGAIVGNQEAMDDFVSVTAGTVSPAEFFDPANLGRLLGVPAPVSD